MKITNKINKFVLAEYYERWRVKRQSHSCVTITDDKEMIVDCCREILSYDENQIRLLLAKQELDITGLNLLICNFSNDGVIVRGKVQNLTYTDL